MSPKTLYRTLALAEAVTWTLLLIGMFLKYVTETTEVGVRIGGGVHGFVFLAYCATTIVIGVDRPWSLRRVLAGLGSSFVPYLTVPFERSADKAGLLGTHWRLIGEEPRGGVERLVAWGLRGPVLAGAVVLVLLVAVFSGLLVLGPPTQWGS
jgi:integral membrane protein